MFHGQPMHGAKRREAGGGERALARTRTHTHDIAARAEQLSERQRSRRKEQAWVRIAEFLALHVEL